MTDTNQQRITQLKRDIEKYTSYGYPCVFLTQQWDDLVALIGDEEATAWYQTLDYCETGI